MASHTEPRHLLRTLLVEDDPKDAELEIAALERAGFAVVSQVATDPGQFQRLLHEAEWDVILCDHNLNSWLGSDALALVHESNRDIPFIVVTASLGDEAAVQYIKEGAADYVLKHRLERLPTAIGAVLRERNLREEKAKLQKEISCAKRDWELTFDTVPDPVLQLDGSGIIQRCNRSFSDLVGQPFSELIGKKCCCFMNGSEVGSLHTPAATCGSMQRREFEQSLHGRVFHTTCTPQRGRSSDPQSGYVVVLHDITETKRAAEEVRRSEALARERLAELEHTYNTAPAGLALYDRELRFLRINEPLAAMNGKPVDEHIGRTLREIIPDVADRVEPMLWEMLVTGEAVTGVELPGVDARTKQPCTVLASYHPLKGEDGAVRAINVVVLDISELKQAREALEQSERDYRRLFDQANDVILVFEPENEIILEANPAACRVYGYERDELVGMSLQALTKDVAGGRMQIKKLLQEESCNDYETIHVSQSGGEVHFLINSSVIDYRGRQAILSFNRDITERKRIEAALEASEAALRERLKEANCLFRASELARLSGFSDVPTLREIVETIPPAFRFPEMACARIRAEGQDYRSKDFHETPWRLSKSIMVNEIPVGAIEVFYREKCNADGEELFLREEDSLLSALAALIESVIVRRKAEELLRASEARYRALFENAPIAFWEQDLSAVRRSLEELRSQGITNIEAYFEEHPERVTELIDQVRILYVNQMALRFFGKSGQASRVPLGEAVTDESRAYFQGELAALANGATNRRGEMPVRDGDGKMREVVVYWCVAPGHEDKYDEVIVSVLDVTETRQLELQLRQAQKMEAIGRLAGGIAHDFNNLLGIVLGYADLLKDSMENEQSRGYIEEVRKAGQRASSLTRQLLAFSRKQVMAPKIIGLNTIVCDMQKMIGQLIGEDIKLVTRLDPELGPVKADPGQIEQVIMNLVVNARDAMSSGGSLTLETANALLDEEYASKHETVKPGHYVMLAVSDTGDGMDPKTQAHIFEPFFTTKKEGTGLGLATTYGIVKQSGGYIWVYSEMSRGTTFKVYLPRLGGDADLASEPVKAVAAIGGNETILLAEDAEALRTLTRVVLERYGYRVFEARDSHEALRLAEQSKEPIDLLVTDVVMPEVSGDALAARVRAMHPETKILYVSGYTDSAIAQHGVLQDDVELLSKPFTGEALALKVRKVLDSQPSAGPMRGK